ncbi:hypothetical protein C0Q70_03177 [Pomacea canaliculata]|uniref:Uncharacterized protein n=1 Tax=Pomacea canaliculata TaxID=400727 RepID=A0A2T7PRZ7_POMCA|nr:hypothetical protein C0Q70_03177 [Pomacea canaliculata]
METRQQHHQSHHQPSLVTTASTTQRDIVSSGVSLTTPTATNHFPGHHDRESTFNFAAEHHVSGQISKHHVSALQPTAHDEDYQRKAHMASDSHKAAVLASSCLDRTLAGLLSRKSQYEQSANASSVELSWKVKDRRHNQSDPRSDSDEDKKCSAEDRDLEKSVPLLTLGAHTEQISYKELSQLEETAV